MRVLFILALLFCVSWTYSVSHTPEGEIEFMADPNPDSPLSIMMKGIINPEDETKNDVKTFFRLAEELIPMASASVGDGNEGKLGLTRYWCYGGTGQAFSLCVYGYAELYVGWKVRQFGESGSYNLTYVPFAYLRAGGNGSVSSYPAEVAYGVYFSITEVELPVNLLLASNQICYSARFDKFPTALYTVINANLLQCERSIPDRTPWACERIEGAGFRHLEYAFDAGLRIDLLPYTCINF